MGLLHREMSMMMESVKSANREVIIAETSGCNSQKSFMKIKLDCFDIVKGKDILCLCHDPSAKRPCKCGVMTLAYVPKLRKGRL